MHFPDISRCGERQLGGPAAPSSGGAAAAPAAAGEAPRWRSGPSLGCELPPLPLHPALHLHTPCEPLTLPETVETELKGNQGASRYPLQRAERDGCPIATAAGKAPRILPPPPPRQRQRVFTAMVSSEIQNEDGHLPQRTQNFAKAKWAGCPRSRREKCIASLGCLPARGFFGVHSLALLHQTSRAGGLHEGLEERTCLSSPSWQGERRAALGGPWRRDRKAGVHWICFPSTIPSGNSYHFKNLFYLVACPKPHYTE